MLVIGHRGAAGLAHENSLEAMQAGIDAGADMLEFDVRLTKDLIPVLSHDFHTLRSHKKASIISRYTLAELKEKFSDQPIVTLTDVLDRHFGEILLNIELKSRGSARIVVAILKDLYVKKDSDWDNVLLSAFQGAELIAARRASKRVNLGLLHSENPYLFLAYYRMVKLSAVGFHRLYISSFALEVAKRLKLFTYVYTVDRPSAAKRLAQRGIEGVVTNRPDIIIGGFDAKKHSL